MKLRLTKRLKKEIENHALYAIFRLNAMTADCYAFCLVRNSKGRLDWEGGWDWSKNIIDRGSTHLYMLATHEFKKIK